jgi:hypothetical protein
VRWSCRYSKLDRNRLGSPISRRPFTKREPDFVTDATQFEKECRVIPLPELHAKYKGKMLEVSGEVVSAGVFSTAAGTKPNVQLDAGETHAVLCITADPEPWVKYIPGQRLKVRGKYDAGAFVATLVDCVIVEVGPAPDLPHFSADQLAKEYGDDPMRLTKKYAKRHLILKGRLKIKV